MLKLESIQQFSRYSDKPPSKAERFNRAIRDLLKKSDFQRGVAIWVNKLQAVIKQYNNTIYHSIKIAPIEACEKTIEKVLFNNLKDNREIQKPKFNLGGFVS